MKNIKNGTKMNQLLHLTLLLGAFCSINLLPMRMTEKGKASAKRWLGLQQREEAISKKRGLLIFLDEQEKDEFGAVSSNLLIALYQEAGPIIVSTSLLYGLREYWQKDNRPIEDLLNDPLLKNLPLLNGPRQETESLLNIILSRTCFKEERWIIKKVNNSLNLLIPLRHLQSLKVNQDKIKNFDSTMETNDVFAIELQLGLKVNHMETIDFRSIIPSYYTQISTYFSFSQSASYFVDSLDIIFCKKSDYINKQVTIPEWCIFIDGHGAINHSIAYLTLNDFKKFLNFLEKEMITTLLVILSCYAAGVNAGKIYGELSLETQRYYSFPIIIKGLNDMVTGGPVVGIDWSAWKDQKKISLNTKISFFDFLEKAKRSEGNYNEIIKPILYDYFIGNTPQIKLPGLEWFSVMDMGNKIVAIGSIFSANKRSSKTIRYCFFF